LDTSHLSLSSTLSPFHLLDTKVLCPTEIDQDGRLYGVYLIMSLFPDSSGSPFQSRTTHTHQGYLWPLLSSLWIIYNHIFFFLTGRLDALVLGTTSASFLLLLQGKRTTTDRHVTFCSSALVILLSTSSWTNMSSLSDRSKHSPTYYHRVYTMDFTGAGLGNGKPA
jgi:hypothetical protein